LLTGVKISNSISTKSIFNYVTQTNRSGASGVTTRISAETQTYKSATNDFPKSTPVPTIEKHLKFQTHGGTPGTTRFPGSQKTHGIIYENIRDWLKPDKSGIQFSKNNIKKDQYL